MTEPPVEVYRQRAANQPRPADWDRAAEQALLAAEPPALHQLALAIDTRCFHADISEYQPPVDDTYPYPILAARFHSGWAIDNNIGTNWGWARQTDRLRLFIGYVPFVPGQLGPVMDTARALFGSVAPGKLALMVDMESGAGFAGPGDHSVEANRWALAFADYTGNWQLDVGYANGGDWQSCWPYRSPWLKRYTAAYGTTDPGTFGWQYFGGDPRWDSPPGFPRSCPPFGAYVDMNVISQPLTDVLAAFGVGGPDVLDPTDPTIMQLRAAIEGIRQMLVQVIGEPTHPKTASLLNIMGQLNGMPTNDELKAAVAGIAPTLSDAQIQVIVAALAARTAPAFDIHSTVAARPLAQPATPPTP